MIDWPSDYQNLKKTGLLNRLLDPKEPLKIWDVEFLSEQKVSSFERLDDQRVDITPFATTGAGHYWAYLTDSLPSPEIVLCYRDSYEAEYIARNMPDFIFKRTVEFAGNEGLGDSWGGWNVQLAKQMVSLVCSSFGALFTNEANVALERIANADSVQSNNGWTTLISENEANELIDRFAPTNRDPTVFCWRE